MEWIENTTPQVYAEIIDEIGKRQYSGNPGPQKRNR